MPLNKVSLDNRANARTGLTEALLATAGDVNPIVDVVNTLSTTVAGIEAAVTTVVAAAIVATSTSQTTDFGVLLTTDKVVMIPATAGSADFITPNATGTLGQSAIVGNLYLVLRAVTL